MLERFKVILCPTYQIASQQPQPEYSVEAEYGREYIEGKYETLVHHDNRSNNPAPCNTDVKSYEDIGGVVMLSHIDIDSVGGIMAITGDKIEDHDFWAGAELIDVKGPHHMYELPVEVVEKLNAIYAWEDERAKSRNHEKKELVVKDVTEVIKDYYEFFGKVLGPYPDKALIEAGRKYALEIERNVEDKCVSESEFIRAFKTDGVFCNGNYYSKTWSRIIPCTVSFNTSMNSITVAFEDGGREQGGLLSAKEIVQELWGKEAGGRDGIAGSPRGQEMTEDDFNAVRNLITRKYMEYKK